MSKRKRKRDRVAKHRTSEVKQQKDAVKASDKRAGKAAKDATSAAWSAVGKALTPEVLDAIEQGAVGKMRAAMSRMPVGAVLPAVKASAKKAFDAGLKEGDKVAPDTFAESGRTSKQARARRYRATGPEMRQARAQSRSFLQSFTRALSDTWAELMGKAKEAPDPSAALGELRATATTLKSGGGGAKAEAFRRKVARRAGKKLATPLADVDWAAARRGETAAWSSHETTVLVEFVATNDDATTPACAFLDGAKLSSKDTKRLQEYTPGLHFRCRSMFVATAGKVSDIDWDEKRSRSIGEPSASSPRRTSYTKKPSQVKVPGSAPNVAPPKRLSDWL